jgi:hypothetical protein
MNDDEQQETTGVREDDQEKWTLVHELEPDLFRVEADGRSRWFVTGADAPGGAWTGARPRVARMYDPIDGQTLEGLLVSRCEGGTLRMYLGTAGPLSVSRCLFLLHRVVEALDGAPPPPEGMSRVHLDAFGVDARGDIVLVPGRYGSAAGRDEACALARLAVVALSGDLTADIGTPPALLAPGMPDELAEFLSDLAYGSARYATDHGLATERVRERLDACGQGEPLPFIAAETGVAVEQARTASTPAIGPGAEALSERRAGVRPRQHEDGQADSVALLRAARGSRLVRRSAEPSEGRMGRRRSRRSGGWAVLVRRSAVPVLGGALLLVGVGILLSGPWHDAEKIPAVGEAGGATSSAVAAESDSLHDPEEPVGAWRALTRLREAALETGDAGALADLSVPNSPAARADAQTDPGTHRGSDVQLSVEPGAPEVVGAQRVRLRSTMGAKVTGASGTVDYGTRTVWVELRFANGVWKVYSVLEAEG